VSQSHVNNAGPTSNSQSAIAARASAVLSEYMSLDELAEELGVNKRTLDRWHTSRNGPPRTYVSRRPIYRREAVLQWLRKREVDPGEERTGGRRARKR
jgi:hypothetical protein